MKESKGFTLVELIVVLLIISILSILAVPNIIKFRNNANQNAYNKKVSLIKLSAENYSMSNKNSLIKKCKSGDISCSSCGSDCYMLTVTATELLNSGSLKSENNSNGCNISNPTGGCMDAASVNVKLFGHNFSTIKAESISVTKPVVRLVNHVKSLVSGESTSSTAVITKSTPDGASCTNTLAYDGTSDNNLRYVGANPCNYVTFNGENAGWRIIGVMTNIDDGTGKKETRIKLVRKNNIGYFSWHSSAMGVNSGYGVNDWAQADIKTELNGDYLNASLSQAAYWYGSWKNARSAYFDYHCVLKNSAQNLIGNAKWHLGALETGGVTNSYNIERGTTTYSTNHTCNDGACPRSTEWTGKVALMYPSDYYFAVGGNVRSTCLNTPLENFGNNSCNTNDWIYVYNSVNPNSNIWLLTPYLNDKSGGLQILLLDDEGIGHVNHPDVYNSNAILPTVYLKPDVKVTSGNGSENSPYVIE